MNGQASFLTQPTLLTMHLRYNYMHMCNTFTERLSVVRPTSPNPHSYQAYTYKRPVHRTGIRSQLPRMSCFELDSFLCPALEILEHANVRVWVDSILSYNLTK